jgi:hypothetical protein
MKACDYNMFQLAFPFDRFDSYACTTRQGMPCVLCVCARAQGRCSILLRPKISSIVWKASSRWPVRSTCSLDRQSPSLSTSLSIERVVRFWGRRSLSLAKGFFLVSCPWRVACRCFIRLFYHKFFLDGFGSWMTRRFPLVFHGGCSAMNTIDV